MKKLMLLFILPLITITPLFAGEMIETAPGASYARFLLFETLAVFWIGIIGLVVIIKMKLREIERIQGMSPPEDQQGTPFLD
jgi:hypothetical protein